ncbi:putative immunity protein [Paenibacillus sp. 19GGS1-52]|uniref:putative immunity protein n=1 Tax=Paenibacillus sp. 19GGS1-52 TaxID=2758563 RepID=UPI001EFAF904|nr:hypothetical protein [Paenibacillus sp. 19GGS1-52]
MAVGKVKFIDTSISTAITELVSKCDHRTLVLWATDCSEHVLIYFEKENLTDNRPRQAIEAGRAWACGEIAMSEARTAAFAAHAAAREILEAAACAAARAAGHAAATAHVASHAVHAATYAAKAATYASDPADANANNAKERNWQFQQLLDLGGFH